MGSHFIPCHILDGPQKNHNELNSHGMTRMALWSPEHRNGVWKTGRGRESGFVCGSLYFLLKHSFIRKLVKTGLFSKSIKTEMQGISTIAGSFNRIGNVPGHVNISFISVRVKSNFITWQGFFLVLGKWRNAMNMSSTSLVIGLRRLQLSLISTSFGVNSATLFPGIFRYENPWERGCLYPINLFENCCVFHSTPLIFSASCCHLTKKTTFDLMWFDIVQ